MTAPVRLDGFAYRGRDVAGAIPDGRAARDLDSDGTELACQVGTVGVDRKAEQEFIPYCDQLNAQTGRRSGAGTGRVNRA